MVYFLELSNVLCMNIVKDWLSMREIGHLDSAFSNAVSRPIYLSYFRITSLILNNHIGDQRMLHWMESRNISFKNVSIKLAHSINQNWDWCVRVNSLQLQSVTYRNSSAYCSIVEASKLKELTISNGGQVVDNDWLMQRLRSCPLLESLSLVSCRSVSDMALMQLPSTCPLLHKIHLYHCPEVNWISVSKVLSKCKLTELSVLVCTHISAISLRPSINYLADLVVCRFSHVKLTSDDIILLGSNCRQLEELRIQFSSFSVNPPVDTPVLFESIKSFEFSDNREINDASVLRVLQLVGPQVTELNLGGTLLSGKDIQLIRFPELKALSLSGCNLRYSDILSVMESGANRLESLDVSHGEKVLSGMIDFLSSNCPNFTSIDVSHTTVLPEDITHLIYSLPALKVIYAIKCSLLKSSWDRLCKKAQERVPLVDLRDKTR